MGEGIRAFVAIDTPPAVRKEVAVLLDQLRQASRDARWVKPEGLHITLVFLGTVSPDFIERAAQELRPVVAGFPRFGCTLNGLGAFPDVRRARVLWVGVGEGAAELRELQQRVVGALQAERVGYRPEKRPFMPHLTLARLRAPSPVGFIQTLSFKSSRWVVERVTIFRSDLRPSGAEYRVLVELPLA